MQNTGHDSPVFDYKNMKKYFTFFLAIMVMFSVIIPVAFARSISDTYYDYQDYLTVIDGDPADLDYTGDGVVVAVIDSGVWQSHPDLAGAIWNNYSDTPNDGVDNDGNGYVDDYYGWNFVDDSADMVTYSEHGTAVAGIIAAQINQWGLAGIAPDVEIMALTVISDTGATHQDIVDAIYYAVDNGANVINLSLGPLNGYTGYSSLYDNAIEYAYNNGVVVVAAAGNGDVESSYSIGVNLEYMPVSPVCNDVNGINMVLGVGASDAQWSNYGSCVDVEAPGVDLVLDTVPAYADGYYLDYMSGTSFSAPMVSAAAALLFEQEDYYTNIDIIDQIISTSSGGVLDIEEALSKSFSIDFDDISEDEVYAGEQITIYGEHFSPRYSVRLVGQSSTHSLSEDEYELLDASTLVVTVPEDLDSGEYYVKFNYFGEHSDEFDVVSTQVNSVSEDVEDDEDEGAIESEEVTTESTTTASTTNYGSLAEQLAGYILLQVEQHGEAWYVNPTDYLRYYMEDGDVAYEMMRSFGLGITDSDLDSIPSVDTQEEMLASTSICSYNSTANRLRGRILLQVEQHGEAWYVHPDTCRRIYMEDGDAAYTIMRYLSLGITDSDLEGIQSGEID